MDDMTPLERKEKMKRDFQRRKAQEKAMALNNHYGVLLYNRFDAGKITYEKLNHLIVVLERWDLFGRFL